MKVAILTWATNTNNYGSILQAYALQSFLNSNGYEGSIIDYSSEVSDYQWPSKISIFRRIIIRKIRKIGDRNNTDNAFWKKQLNDCCKAFVENKLIVTKKYNGINQIKQTLSDFDVFVCGSDQVWSMQRVINPVYYLTWVDEKKGKIAYAPSIPSGNFNSKKRKLLVKNTEGFTAISVREEAAAKEISNILNKDVISTVDPTLLVDDDFWEATAELEQTDKYILCYFLGKNEDYKKCVKEVETKTGYDVKIIPFSSEPFGIDGEIQFGVGPTEFLNLIRNAEIVLTDSYHGSIFSVIFENDFVLFKRFIDGEKKDENERIYDLVEKLQLDGILCDASNFVFDSIKKPNYEVAKRCLLEQREKSKDFLLNALKRCNDNE